MGSFLVVSEKEVTSRSRRQRRPPPPFRMVKVVKSVRRSPRLVAVTLGGPSLEGFGPFGPAASVRILLPSAGVGSPELPSWNGNEFLLPDRTRPSIRTFTPRRLDRQSDALDIEVVVHGEGVASFWATSAQVGNDVGVSGPGRGYEVDAAAPSFFIAGDETAIPAVSQLLEVLPEDKKIEVHLEIADNAARVEMPDHRGAAVHWHELDTLSSPGDALFDIVRLAELDAEDRVWVAGEAAAIQRVRRHLFEERGVVRAYVTARGYWKHGKSAEMDPAS